MTTQRTFAIVTGASSGIGLELARLAARDGHDLLIAADRDLGPAAEELRSEGVEVETVEADLARSDGVEQLLAAAGDRPVDLLFANAGHSARGGFADQDWDDARHVLDTNVTGTIHLIHRVVRGMRARRAGRILITGSIAGYAPGGYSAVYNASKAFIDSFAEALRAEVAEDGVSVTNLMPGGTETEFFHRAGLDDTKIGQSKKDDPAWVARVGYDAMMEGRDQIVPGLKNKLASTLENVTPAALAAGQHGKAAKPGSAAEQERGGASKVAPLLIGAGLVAGALAAGVAVRRRGAGGSASLTEVARFDHQVTGVTVAETGRIFVNFPRWTEDAPVSVGEVVDGRVVPYPDERWNGWRNSLWGKMPPEDRFVCVQSVVADGRGSLWVLDPAAPNSERIVEGGPKLVRIDLATDRVVRVYPIGEDVALQGSYMNDVRFSPGGAWAYITDSGVRGAIIVIDLASGEAKRLLDGHPSTQPEFEVQVHADGKPLKRPDGRAPAFAADGIALTPDGRRLYWQALTGRTLYRIDTAALREARTGDDLGDRVERVGENGVADGLHIDRATGARMYVTAPEEDAVKLRRLDQPGDELELLVRDRRLRWPDTLAEGPDGAVHVTASRIQDSAWFKPKRLTPRLPTKLFRIDEAR